MASPGTSLPSAADTFWYLMRLPVRLSIWLKWTVLRLTAEKSFTGTLTSPKLIEPLQMGLGMVTVFPNFEELKSVTACVRSGGEDGSGDEVGAEGGEDGQVEQAGGGHHGAVVALPEGGAGDEHEHDGGHRAGRPEPA